MSQTPNLPGQRDRERDWAIAQAGLKRFSPRRSRWPELAEYDRRISELETRLGEVTTRFAELHERKAAAPAENASRLAPAGAPRVAA